LTRRFAQADLLRHRSTSVVILSSAKDYNALANRSATSPTSPENPIFPFPFSNFRFSKKNEAPCGLLFPRGASTPIDFFYFAPVICLLFQAFPSYPPCRWAELSLD
jgi:hypothetical protein